MTTQTETKTDFTHVLLSKEAANKLLVYLGKQPAAEVLEHMNTIGTAATVIVTQNKKEESNEPTPAPSQETTS